MADTPFGSSDAGASRDLEGGNIMTDREAASAFVQQLVQTAGRIVPDRTWSAEELAAVPRFAIEGGEPPVSFLEGRAFDRRLDEALERANRYGENFSVMVVNMGGDLTPDLYASVLDGLLERLRRSDQVFLFLGRAAIILPYTSGKDLSNLIDRIRSLIEAVLGSELEIGIDHVAFPADINTVLGLKAWVSQRLAKQEPT